MAKKRKAVKDSTGSSSKRRKWDTCSTRVQRGHHPVLELHYETVCPLRTYVLTRFPDASQSRKQRVRSIPIWSDKARDKANAQPFCNTDPATVSIEDTSVSNEESEAELSRLLDTTIVGFDGSRISEAGIPTLSKSVRIHNVQQLSQRLRDSVKATCSQNEVSQQEIVDFAVGYLFNTIYHGSIFQPHVLCNGFSRTPTSYSTSELWSNGLYCTFTNCNAATMQNGAWPSLLKLLGKDGDHVILDLILHCAVFVPLGTGRNNFCQISGLQLSELPLLTSSSSSRAPVKFTDPRAAATIASTVNKSSQVKIVRNRMFYARPGLNGKGLVRLGLQHIHVFNRFPDADNPQHVAHVMKYIFPRQFGLHNVFTCRPDHRDTAQAQKDYTMREQEIMVSLRREAGKPISEHSVRTRIPKRLRGVASLIGRILRRHTKCAYVELLRLHCPVETIDAPDSPVNVEKSATIPGLISYPQAVDIVDLATPQEYVFAFCRSVLLRILPPELLDADIQNSPNLRLLLRSVLVFVHSRKRETLDLHSLVQGLRISDICWLVPPNVKPGARLAASDISKRREILEELLYYIFDSILIPLIRSNFHVTESNNHVHRLFYFRHDVWRRLTQPCLNELQLCMFEACAGSKKGKAKLLTTPYGHMRLVPKGSTFRPIMNLKRRPMIQKDGRWILGPRSVNAMLKPVYSMIKHEKLKQPGLLGSSMFSIDEIYPRLKQFSEMLNATGRSNEKLYFAKVDVTHCFDTIPQDAVLELMEGICGQNVYCSSRHAEISARHTDRTSTHPLTKRFRDREPARALTDIQPFQDYISYQYGDQRRNTIFVEQGAQMRLERTQLMNLLSEHISSTNVKLGKKFLKQKRGIPQGSILSSILCNFFYGQFEIECLDFLNTSESLLLRLLDDFLLITLNKAHASKFLAVMHAGNQKFGITVKASKSLSNFPFTYLNHAIPHTTNHWFPYCGKCIHTTRLSIARDLSRRPVSQISSSISLERSSHPGSAFHRLSLDALKRQLHAQYTDTTLNAPSTVLRTLYHDFHHSALRMQAYIRGLGPRLRPRTDLIIRTIDDMGRMTFSIAKATSGIKDDVGYECCISEGEVMWLLARAFRDVFGRKAIDEGVVRWLDGRLRDRRKVKGLRKERVWRRLKDAVAGAVREAAHWG